MRFFSSEYEKGKAQHKKELVRNEFKVVGKYNIPLIKKQNIDVDKIERISFVDTILRRHSFFEDPDLLRQA